MGRPSLQLVPNDPSEHELQEDCTAMLRILLLPDVAWTAIDHAHSLDRRLTRNGVPIGLIEMQKRKRRGIKPGIWDYLFWHRRRAYAIELKVGDNDLDDDQIDFGKALIAAGLDLKVCWTKAQVFETTRDWGLLRAVREAA